MPGTVELRGGIWTQPHSGHEGNGLGEDTNEPVRYKWSITANALTLKLAGAKRCDRQSDTLARIWRPNR